MSRPQVIEEKIGVWWVQLHHVEGKGWRWTARCRGEVVAWGCSHLPSSAEASADARDCYAERQAARGRVA